MEAGRSDLFIDLRPVRSMISSKVAVSGKETIFPSLSSTRNVVPAASFSEAAVTVLASGSNTRLCILYNFPACSVS